MKKANVKIGRRKISTVVLAPSPAQRMPVGASPEHSIHPRICSAKTRLSIGRILAAASVSVALGHHTAMATIKSWGGQFYDNWSIANRWSPAGVPDHNDDVFIATPGATVVYDYTGPSVEIDSVTVASSGGAAPELYMPNNGTVLYAGTEEVGGENLTSTGDGNLTQLAGTNDDANDLIIGKGSTGTYNLGGTGLLIAYDEIIGWQDPYFDSTGNGESSGFGSFNQIGGTNGPQGNVDLGVLLGDTGVYNLQGGTLSVASGYNFYVGGSDLGLGGAGELNISGGSATIPGTLQISPFQGSQVNVSGGSLTVGTLDTGGRPSDFNWTGGTLSFTSGLVIDPNQPLGNSLSVGSGQSLIVSGGAGVGNHGTATFTLSGSGFNIADFLGLGSYTGSTGTYTQTGGTLEVSSQMYVGLYGDGSYFQSGGSAFIGDLFLGFYSGGTGVEELSNNAILFANDVYVGGSSTGAGGTGVLAVEGGEMTVSGPMTIYNTPGNSVVLEGGVLHVGSLVTGGNPSLLNWSGGTFDLGSSLTISSSTTAVLGATVNVNSGMTLSVEGQLIIGTGGTLAMTGSGGLTASGAIVQSAGTFNSPALTVGIGGNSTSYNYTGGTATISSVNLSAGGTITLGASPLGFSTFNQTGGSLNTSGNDEYVGVSSAASFTQSGGTNSTTNLWLGFNSFGSGTYNLSGTAALTATGRETIGAAGVGTFNQTGGSNTVGTSGSPAELDLGSSSGFYDNEGTYNLSGHGNGLLVHGSIYVGGSSSGAGGIGVLNLSDNASAVAISGGGLTVWSVPGSSLNVNDSLLFLNATLTNDGNVSLSGAAIATGGIVNNGSMSGNGTLSDNTGSSTFTNNGQFTQSGGNVVYALAGNFTNTAGGSVNLASGYQFQLNNGGWLVNSGEMNLNGATISASGNAQFQNSPGGFLTGAGTINTTFSNNYGTISLDSGILHLTGPFTNYDDIELNGNSAQIVGIGSATNSVGSVLEGKGTFSAGSIANNGTIEPVAGTLTLDGAMNNGASGTLAAATGERLSLPTAATSNAGLISLTGGTIDTGFQALTNTGQITGYGTLRTNGLINGGVMTLTGGTSTVNGPVTNSSGKTINIKYQPAIFTGNVTNNGTIKTTNTTVTFTGTYIGNAYISDPSTNIFQNNVTVVSGGQMTGGGGDQYFMSGGTFANQGTYSNTGLLQSSDPTTNSGTFIQGGTQNWSAGTTFTNTAGTATFQSDAGSASAFNLSVNATGGTIALASNQHWAGLSLIGSGSLDIANNRVIINYSGGSDPIASIEQWIKDGYYGLPGPAIFSSAITTDDSLSGLSYGIGYADGADGLVAGLPSGEIEITYTLLGDANLDGTVNTEDFTPFSHNLGQPGGWDKGDFNYDGTVNSEDFTSFSHDLNQSAVLASGLEVANGISLANVPEPACAAIAVVAGLGILRRRRRN